MSEAADWKQKYRDSLLEMESEEKRWRQVEQALRRLVGRLCAAGMGVDQQLDAELRVLAAANRRNADAPELERLATSLTAAVEAVDAVSPIPTIVVPALTITRWDSACAATAKILQHLKAAAIEDAGASELLAKLPQAKSDAELAEILTRSAELIRCHGAALAEERSQAAALLADVTDRLEEMAGYLTESRDETRSRYADSVSVNDSVMSHVRELSAEVRGATELRALQTAVTARLETVAQQVLDFRLREEGRLRDTMDRAERMRTRIADLEREAVDLNSKLDRERHRARLDPLTRLGNRQSFDERVAHSIQCRAQTEQPVWMLLWDLDNFKFVNDSYGHRAGDRVLQNVAACFMSGLRADDFVARIGGEEFVVILTGLPFERVMGVADTLRSAVAALRFHFRGTPVHVTMSCGLTDLRDGDSAAMAFDRADAALYRAKHGGKNLCIAA